MVTLTFFFKTLDEEEEISENESRKVKKKKKSKKNREGKGSKRRSRREVTLERALVKVCTVMNCAPSPPSNCISKKYP